MSLSSEEVRQQYKKEASLYDWKLNIIECVSGIRRLREKMLSKARGKVLDVATGTGRNYPYLLGCDVTGIDLSPDMLEIAKQRAQSLQMNLDAREMDAQHMEFKDDQFDTVISTLGICSYPDPVSVLQEMSRVCQSEGLFLFLEHGKSSNRCIALLQNTLSERHVKKIGCHLNRDPLAIVEESGLHVQESSQSFFGILFAIEASKTKK